jgi:hypothetical protein
MKNMSRPKMKNLKKLSDAKSGRAFSFKLYVSVFLAVALLSATQVQTRSQTKQTNSTRSARGNATTITPQGSGSAVKGTGTAGMIPLWLDSSSIGDSSMSDAGGNIGIGTTTPGSKLSVVGMIETTLGGYKFPDGTLQTTAGLGSIFHDATLTGMGTSGSPLKLALPLHLSGAVTCCEDPVILITNTASGGQAVNAEGGSNGGRGVMGKGGDNGAPGGQHSGGIGVNGVGGANSNSAGFGGIGVLGTGGGGNGYGGRGVVGAGGIVSGSGYAGDGVNGLGGTNNGTGSGGNGVLGLGGSSNSGPAGTGVVAYGGNSNSGDAGYGLYAKGGNGTVTGLAAYFEGNVVVTGAITKGGGSFKIDHPLDPENKYLYHSFVESPDMMNIYNGNVTTDANGDAVITLPDWFEALNCDFRYQLTVIGTFAQAIVASEVKENRFSIKSNAPNVKVSWQVTGIRQDAWANKHRIPTEANKAEKERGSYLHPELFNQPEQRSVEYALHPEIMRQVKETRERMKQKAQTNNQ